MSANLSNLLPSALWKHFEEFLKIPHGSANEQALGDYIVSVAERLNLEWKRDRVGNVVVSKPASPGYEDAEGVILQGHLDMVCEKNSDVTHDFEKDPIQAEIQGDWVQAKGTTLGADNGIGDCAGLAILEDNSLEHPALECLFTVEEETGLTGATQLQPGFLKGKKLLNLDSEDEGEFTIGCAGGADSRIFLPLTTEAAADGEQLQVKISGLQGGHSGVDINLGRGNAIKLLARLLWQVKKGVPHQLASIEGGNLRNAIPREAWATVSVKPEDKEAFISAAKKTFESVQDEYRVVDPEAALTIEPPAESATVLLSPDSQKTLINLLFSLPHGVIAWHPEMEGLVETSTNLAVIRTHENRAEIICSTRSSTATALEAARSVLASLSELAGAEIELEDGYPGWKPNLQSPLLQILKDVYHDLFDQEPQVAAIHAGLECGIIGEKFPGMDMISFGPTIKFPHSPSEKVHIPSVESFWKFLLKLLSELK
ncbi:MAG: beta-Ala-His dipeptidase [Candidatus Aminicenantes bacterium]|nr:beta-Ala-His dipeptidase [Candidatus Aminicenantes bacterium]